MIDGKTPAPPYVFNVDDIDPATGKEPQYDVVPLLTVGDEVPFLEGEFGNFSPSDTETYAMAGIPDGLGYTEVDGIKYVFMNHELADDKTTQISSTVEGQIRGARVSVFAFDENWNAIGGRNLIETVSADGGIYELNLESGNYELVNPDTGETDPTMFLNMNDHENFTRFCSGYLAASGFVDENGKEIPFWFAPEESTASYDSSSGGGGLVVEENAKSRGWAIDANGNGVALDGLGVYAKEQVYSPELWRATNSDYTVLLSTEDFRDGELYMYIGEQTEENPNGFTNKPSEFDLYVLKVIDPETRQVYAYETMPENKELIGRWQKVPDKIALTSEGELGIETQEKLSNWVNEDGRSTNFRRLEDLAEDPNNLNTFYFLSTGTDDIAEGSDKPDNAFGKLHRITLEVDEATGKPTADMTFETLLEGGAKTGVSYDNMDVDSNGNVLMQEDRTAGSGEVLEGGEITGGGDILDAQRRNARVLSYNIAINEKRVGNDQVTDLFEINQAAESTVFDTSYGRWESSGIIEIDPEALMGQSSYLLTVQAHSIGNDSGVYTGQYAEGGQLILANPLETFI